MLDIGQQQFLVLLFVIETERHQCCKFHLARTRLDQFQHCVVDMLAILQYLGERRS